MLQRKTEPGFITRTGARAIRSFCLHGWPLTGDTFDEPHWRWPKRASARSSPTAAASAGPISRGRYDYDTFADDIAAILDDAGITQPVALVGFSMGGGEVARFQTKYPGRTSKAVLISAVVPYMLKADDNPNGVPQATFDEMTAGMKKDREHFFTDCQGF